ncbi:hypothetical protein FQZ97_1054560 [compost metagenome]
MLFLLQLASLLLEQLLKFRRHVAHVQALAHDGVQVPFLDQAVTARLVGQIGGQAHGEPEGLFLGGLLGFGRRLGKSKVAQLVLLEQFLELVLANVSGGVLQLHHIRWLDADDLELLVEEDDWAIRCKGNQLHRVPRERYRKEGCRRPGV